MPQDPGPSWAASASVPAIARKNTGTPAKADARGQLVTVQCAINHPPTVANASAPIVGLVDNPAKTRVSRINSKFLRQCLRPDTANTAQPRPIVDKLFRVVKMVMQLMLGTRFVPVQKKSALDAASFARFHSEKIGFARSSIGPRSIKRDARLQRECQAGRDEETSGPISRRIVDNQDRFSASAAAAERAKSAQSPIAQIPAGRPRTAGHDRRELNRDGDRNSATHGPGELRQA